MGVKVGDALKLTYEPAPGNDERIELVELTQKLIKRHENALKNLANR